MFIDKSQACLTTSSHNDSQVGHCRSGQSPWQAMAAQALSWVAWVIQGIQAPWHWQRLRPPPPGGGLASIWGRPSQPWPCLWSLRSVRVLSRVAEISMGLISGPWHSLSLSESPDGPSQPGPCLAAWSSPMMVLCLRVGSPAPDWPYLRSW